MKLFDCDNPTDLSDVTLAILAGGAGTRMGMPKSLLRIGDEPILRWLLKHYSWPGPTLLITAPDTPDSPGAEAFNAHAVDSAAGNGPLQGLKTAIENAATEMLVVVTVDMPQMDAAKLGWLVHQLQRRSQRLGVMCRRDVSDASLEPFPFALRRAALGHVERRLTGGERAVRALCDGTDIEAITAPSNWPDSVWMNLNYPDQLAAFLEVSEHHREQPA